MLDFLVGWKNCATDLRRKGIYLVWNIWLECNLELFENKSTPNFVIVGRVRQQVEVFRYLGIWVEDMVSGLLSLRQIVFHWFSGPSNGASYST